jgi:hypothetical protein
MSNVRINKGEIMIDPSKCPKCGGLLTVNHVKGMPTDCSCNSCNAVYDIRIIRAPNLVCYLAELNPKLIDQPMSFDGMNFEEMEEWLNNRIETETYVHFHIYHVEK